MHFQATEELYQASWRPTLIDAAPQFGPTIPVAPEPSEGVQDLAKIAKPVPTKPAGAYRPPGARGLATPSIFKREDEGGAARMPTNGTSTPPRAYNRSPGPGGNGYGGQQNGGRLTFTIYPGAKMYPPCPQNKRGYRRQGNSPLNSGHTCFRPNNSRTQYSKWVRLGRSSKKIVSYH